MNTINERLAWLRCWVKSLLEPIDSYVSKVLANIVPMPTPAEHAYLTSIGLSQVTSLSTYAGEHIAGVPCNGCVSFIMRDIAGKARNCATMVSNDAGKYEVVFIPGAQIAETYIPLGPKSDEILIVPDIASALTLQGLTEKSVAVVFYALNILSVTKALRKKYPEADITICSGTYRNEDQSAMLQIANEAAAENAAKIATPCGANTFNELYRTEGEEAVLEQLRAAREASDSEVTMNADDLAESRRSIASPNPVNAAGLFAGTVACLRRYVSMPFEFLVAMALWCIQTHFIESAHFSPILGVFSAIKRCGKTTVIKVLRMLVARPVGTVNLTPAALYHLVASLPTLLIDEADRFLNDKASALVGILNAVHTRSDSYVLRVVNNRLKKYPTFCAILIAMIKHPPATISDRSIVIEMRRKRTDQKVEKFVKRVNDDLAALRSLIESFYIDNRDFVREAQTSVPNLGNDRAADNWTPLFAVASCAGAEWTQLATEAAIALTPEDEQEEDAAMQLLVDLHDVFTKSEASYLPTTDIINALCADDEKRWATFNHRRPISPHDFAKLLKQFKISSSQQRIGGRNLKVYRRDDFQDAFERYVEDQRD